MPRRRDVPKRKITPDPKYKDKLVAKFTNSLMVGGKKSTAEGILYGAFVHLADLVVDAGVVEDPLRNGRLAGIDVRHDADVARAFERGFAGHGLFRCSLKRWGRNIDETPSSLRSPFFGKRHVG